MVSEAASCRAAFLEARMSVIGGGNAERIPQVLAIKTIDFGLA